MKPLPVFFLALAITASLWRTDAAAQVLNDPTRPPAGLAPADAAATGALATPRLQSVMITPSERFAIIGGERIKLGGKYGEAEVIGITETEVTLRSASGTETLRMYPEVGIKRIEAATPTATGKPVKKRRGPTTTNAQGKQG